MGLGDSRRDFVRYFLENESQDITPDFKNVRASVSTVDAKDSPYTTDGEREIQADTSNGAVTIEFSSDDIPESGNPARPVRIINTGTGDITLQTEGSETLEPGGLSSLTFTVDNVHIPVVLVAGAVRVDRNRELSTLSTDEAHIKPEQGTTDGIRTEPFVHALRQGYIVGVSPNAAPVTIDPREHADDATALQQANDSLVSNLDSSVQVGEVWIPPLRPDGTRFSIGSTVTFGSDGDDKTVAPQGWGFTNQREGGYIETTINDGSAVFEIIGDLTNNTPARLDAKTFGGFVVNASGNDAEALRLKDVNHLKLTRPIRLTNFNRTNAAGVVVFDGAIFNSYIDSLRISGGNGTARGIAFENTTGNGPPGELVFGPHNNISLDGFAVGVHSSVAARVRWGGRIEGAETDDGGAITMTDGELTVLPSADFGNSDKVAPATARHHIDFDGTILTVCDGVTIGAIPDDAIHVGTTNLSRVHISDDLHINGSIGSDIIHMEGEPPAGNATGYSVIPREEAFRGHSVTYPSPRWETTRHPDGWQKGDEGTLTLTGGAGTGEANVQSVTDQGSAVTQDSEIMVTFRANDPSFNADYGFAKGKPHRDWDDTNSHYDVTVRAWWTTDPGTGNDVTLDWTIWYRSKSR